MTELERAEMAFENMKLMETLSPAVLAGLAWFMSGLLMFDAEMVEKLNTRLKLGADGYAKQLIAEYDARTQEDPVKRAVLDPTYTETC